METTERIIATIRLCCLLTLALVIGLPVAYAETVVGGVIAADSVWSAAQSPYLVTSDVSVESGAVLTVEAGVTVRFQATKRLTVQNGGLKVSGSVAAPVLFTSASDLPGGTPAAGDWGGIRFLDGTVDASTVISYLNVRYGVTTSLYGASPTFNNCKFENNSGYALAIDLASFPHGSGNSAVGNGINAVKIPAGVMETSGAWDLTSIPYYLEGAVYVGLAPTLAGITPASVEQTATIDAAIIGTRLNGATQVLFSDPSVTASIQAGGTSTSLPVKVSASAAAPLGPLGMTVTTPAGEVSLPSALQVVPPTPVVTSATPNRLYVRRPDTTISITGQHFTLESVVYLDNATLATTFVSPSTLTAIVPPQLLSAASQLRVKNPDPRASGSYIVSTALPFTVELPPFTFSPANLSMRQGQVVTTLNLTIPFAAPAGGVTANLTSTNTSAATVPATVTIAEGATSIPVTVSAPDTTNNHDATADIYAAQDFWVGNKATVTIRPEPTVNLSPVTLLSGQGFTFFLTVTLTDPAPAGGLTVNLSASPANVVTLPASVFIAQGATQAQVTVSNTGTGATFISASVNGYTVGDGCSVTVRPVLSTAVTPLVSQSVGVKLESSTNPTIPPVTYTPLTSRPVGIVHGPIITGLAPNRAPIGSQDLTVRVIGNGFSADSSVSIAPTQTGITLRNVPIVVAGDGSYLEFRIDIASDAPIMERTVIVTSGGKTVPVATTSVNRFAVTWPPPELWSLSTDHGLPNTDLILQISGKYLQNAGAVSFEPSQGIQIGTTISVSSDGTSLTVPIHIAADAISGSRSVWIATPGGATSQIQQPGNIFRILTAADPGSTYSPLVSRPVGVTIPTTAATSQDVIYSPLVSRAVGVSLGSIITGVAPISGAISTTDLHLRVNGYALDGVDSFTIEPNTGLTITRPNTAVAADGSWVDALVTIAADAPLTERLVILKKGTSVVPASTPAANRFRVTLPMPEMTSMFPLRSKAGTTITLTISGRLLSGATAISFLPADGITVSGLNVSTDGTSATATVIIAPGATLGQRTVTITTPGGTTSLISTSVNTFEVINPAATESTFAALISQAVGISIPITTPPIPPVDYGPVVSQPVGISIPLPPGPTSMDTTISPLVTRPVGVTVGTVMTGMSPATLVPGTTRTLTISGFGLDTVTSLSISPTTGLMVGTPTPAQGGTSLTVDVTADAAAPRAPRTVLLKTADGSVSVPIGGANHLYVGAPPEIVSLSPATLMVGNNTTLTISGYNLDGATSIRFEPADGVWLQNFTVINSNTATVTLTIDGTAPGGQRVVVIDGPYGASTATSGANNTFGVTRPIAATDGPSRPVIAANRPALRPTIAGLAIPFEYSSSRTLNPVALPCFRKYIPLLAAEEPRRNNYSDVSRLKTIRHVSVGQAMNRYLSWLSQNYHAPPPEGVEQWQLG